VTALAAAPLSVTHDAGLFRAQLRSWFEQNPPPRHRAWGSVMVPLDDAGVAAQRDWQRRLFDAGWAGIAWPVEHGGRGASATQQLIFHEELVRAGGSETGEVFLVGLSHAGPTIIACGTGDQQRRWLGGILRGELIFAQCFSEPGAGSDLAAISTRAVVDGDALVVTGEKRWSSYAQHADWGELLVRTDSAHKHAGLTYAVVDLRAPGVTVRPLRTMGGDQHFCEVRFDEVRVPLSNVIGALGEGWRVANTTLTFERSTVFAPTILALLHALQGLARTTGSDPVVADEVARLGVRALAVRALLQQSVAEQEVGQLGAGASALKLLSSELNFEVEQLRARLDPEHLQRWFVAFGLRIGGGTSEIQRTILAEKVLGLPKGAP
jgi:alkylation response protein AidB-like acyl-CoA dehydrogenase